MEQNYTKQGEKTRKPFSNNLSFLLKVNHQTQEDLAKTLSKSRQAVSLYCNGSEPDYDTLVMIAKHFNVSIDWLLGMPDSPKEIDMSKSAIMKAYALVDQAADNLQECLNRKITVGSNILLGSECFCDAVESLYNAFLLSVTSDNQPLQCHLDTPDNRIYSLSAFPEGIPTETMIRFLVYDAFSRLTTAYCDQLNKLHDIVRKDPDLTQEFYDEVKNGKS